MNPEAERLLGWSEADLAGQPFLHRVHSTDDIPSLNDSLSVSFRECLLTQQAFQLDQATFRRRDGSTFLSSYTLNALLTNGLSSGAVLLFRDITERKRIELRLSGQYEVARVLAEATSIPMAAQGVLRTICTSFEWIIGIFWFMEVETGELRAMEHWSSSPHGTGPFLRMSREITFVSGRGLPGRVWESGEPAWIRDVVIDDNFPRARAASQDGLHSAIGFPP
jgi:PAS domain S-box-containing protein